MHILKKLFPKIESKSYFIVFERGYENVKKEYPTLFKLDNVYVVFGELSSAISVKMYL